MTLQGRLPLWRALFVDWHGVLSADGFWSSVRNGRDTPLRRSLNGRLNVVFNNTSSLADQWMRGSVTTGDLFGVRRSVLGRRRPDFLERRLIEDCLQMRVDVALSELLLSWRADVLVVVATDNTADFAFAITRAQRNPGHIRSSVLRPSTLHELAPALDGVLCSSTLGVLKAEAPERFFGPWLAAHGLSFGDALLLDDREDNCAAFEGAGGTAVRWNSHGPDRFIALERLEGWINQGIGGALPSDHRSQ